jgi:List-Bact-rpt repeat protein
VTRNPHATTCSLVVTENLAASATFASTYTLSVGRSNKGAVTSDDGGISCGTGTGGGACSSKYATASLVTLRAVAPAGAQLLGWGGACSGTAATCQVAIAKATSVQANFSK